MPRKYNSANRVGVKRGPYKGYNNTRKKVLIDANGKKNYYEIKKLREEIEKNTTPGSERTSALNKLDERISQAKAGKVELTLGGYRARNVKTKYENESAEVRRRMRVLASLGYDESKIAAQLGVDVVAIEWLPDAGGKKPIRFRVNGVTYKIKWTYTDDVIWEVE